MNLAVNIKEFRKARHMTQEQLAETLGVTVGAVSKWESGLTTPDLSLILSMASFFETSVDVLLGYELHKQKLDKTIGQIGELRNSKKFQEAVQLSEQELMKYPNSFDLVYRSATLYSLKGIEEENKKDFNRAIELYNRALELLDQNKDEKINDWSIRNHIASCYMGLEENEKGLELLKGNNADGLNSGEIGYILADTFKKTDEALPYLSESLIRITNTLLRVISGFSQVYYLKKDYKQAKDVFLWFLDFYKGLKPQQTSYIDKEITQVLTGVLILDVYDNDLEMAKEHLSQALESAKEFDSNPTYKLSNLKFVNKDLDMTAFDNFGISAKQGIYEAIIDEKDKSKRKILLQLWEEATN